jgi:hypothetical protein
MAMDESKQAVSAAQYDLTRRQRRWPPWPDLPWSPPDQSNRAVPRRLMSMLPRESQFRLAAAFGGRDFRVGEVGITKPNAETQAYPDDSRCVRIHSGLIDFVHLVARILFSGSNINVVGGVHVAKVADIGVVGERLNSLYEQWRGGGIWRGERLAAEGFELHELAANRAEQLAHTVLLFYLSHEIGHAVLHASVPPSERTAAQEHEADAYGIDLAVLGYGLGRDDLRMAIAGATVAIRSLTALELLGHKFPGLHPKPTARLDQLRRKVRRLSDSRESYFSSTTVAYSLEEHMHAAELRIQAKPGRTSATDERLVSRLFSMLLEHERDNLPFDQMRKVFAFDMESASAAVRRRAGRSARMALSPASPTFVDRWNRSGERYRGMGAMMSQLVEALPPLHRRDFEMRSVPSHGDS